MADSANDFLAHYGVPGMKWGRRKSRSSTVETSSSSKSKVSDDAKEVAEAKKKIAKGGTDSLNNKELQAVVNRMNLEQQYTKLVTEPKKVNAGQKIAADILGKSAKSVASEFVKTGIKEGAKLGYEIGKSQVKKKK